MKFTNFSHKTSHLKGKQHQLDPNLDLKQLVHHATVQYVDRDVDGDVDVYDNPKKKIPDENVSSAVKAQEYSNKLIAKQKGEIKHTKRGIAYEDKKNNKCEIGKYYCYTDKKCKPIPAGFMVDPEGMVRKENGASIDEGARIPRKPGQPAGSKKHSDLYTDENPKETIHGLGFKDVKTAKQSVSKIKNSGKAHAHKIQAAVAMEQRAKEMGKSSEAAVFRSFINSMKEKTKEMNEEGLRDWFGKSKSDGGKPGWVQSDGSPCANEPGETKTPKCFSRSKLASMSKSQIASAVRRKRERDPEQQSKSGAASPTYVSTDSPIKKMKKESFNENHKAIAAVKEKDEEGYMASTEMDTIDSAVKKLRKIIKKGDSQLPAWVQSKITKATDYIDTAADYLDSDEMSEAADAKGKGSGTKDACYHKVKSRYSVWPSAYASGALVKCRKVGASNWGNKSESITVETADGRTYAEFIDIIGSEEMIEAAKKCWTGYKKKGMKTMFGKKYPNCVKTEEKDPCNHSNKGDECPLHGKKECPLKIDEATRIQASTGNIILSVVSYRGKNYILKMFFPQTKKPNRAEVEYQVQKVYPDSRVTHYSISDYKPGEPFLYVNEEVKIKESAAWQKKEGKNKSGGLNEKGRKSYERENPGSDLKAPQPKGGPRRDSFCARSAGQMKMWPKAAKDPNSRLRLARKKWNC